jgi:hypothetical protein
MTNSDQKKPEAPPTVEQFAHKNPPVGPRTGTIVPEWRKDRDYENFNPTPEK